MHTLMSLWSLLKLGMPSMSFFRSRSKYSNTRYSRRSAWMTSCNLIVQSVYRAATATKQGGGVFGVLTKQTWSGDPTLLRDEGVVNSRHQLGIFQLLL